jgi:molybdopterin molybdotransferase
VELLRVDTINEVQTKMDAYFSVIKRKTTRVNLRNACGCYLAEDIVADTDVPGFRRSVVDGYAVRGSDTFGVSESIPVFLKIIGSVQMGEPAGFRIGPGETAYVPTGGMIPDGADAMVMVEHTELLDDVTVGISRPAAPNSNLMNIADDYAEGERFYNKGHRISAKDIGLLAACGKASVLVYKKPLITILSTGDELIPPGQRPEKCQVRDINAYAIAALAEASGAKIQTLEIVADQYDVYRTAVSQALEKSDLVLVSGGSSAGNKDMTEKVIDSMGSPGVITHGLAIKPGKPTIIGIFEQQQTVKAIIGLPGHPMSAIIVYYAVVDRFIRRYYFENQEAGQSVTAVMTENIHAGEGRETYQLVSLDGMEARPIRAKSGSILQFIKADGYVVMSANSEGIEAGTPTEVVLIGTGY